MLFYSAEEFFRIAEKQKTLTYAERLSLADAMKAGDAAAKEKLLCSYLPYLAGVIRRQPPQLQTLRLILRAWAMLEREAERFDFRQTGESFLHRLSWGMRQAVTREIAER